jgi:hypothetical protein
MDQQTSSTEAKNQITFRPICMDDSPEQLEVNTIFREMDVDGCSSPTVAKANPISENCEELRTISPQTSSPIDYEYEERGSWTEGIGCDWAMEAEEPIENVTALNAGQSTSLYSFFFETTEMDQDFDDFTISSCDTGSVANEDFCLDSLSEDPAAFWESSLAPPTHQRRLSPAQISIASDSEMDLIQLSSIENELRANI